MWPLCSARPPMSCTSNCRCLRVRFAASRTDAKTSASMSSSASPSVRRSRKRAVVSASSASERLASSASRSFTRATILRSFRSSDSFESRRRVRTLTGTRSLVDLQRQLQPRWIEERADGLALMDATDRLRKEGRDGHDFKLLGVASRRPQGDSIGGDQSLDPAAGELLGGISGKDGVGAADVDLIHTAILEDAHRVENRCSSVDLVVDDDRAGLVDIADDVHDLAPAAVVAVGLLHEDERDLQGLGDAARGGALERVDHDEELHDRVADRRADERLDQEDVVFASVLLDLHEDVVVGELEHIDSARLDLQMTANISGELGVGVSGVDRQSSEHGSPPATDRRWSCMKSIRAVACVM